MSIKRVVSLGAVAVLAATAGAVIPGSALGDDYVSAVASNGVHVQCGFWAPTEASQPGDNLSPYSSTVGNCHKSSVRRAETFYTGGNGPCITYGPHEGRFFTTQRAPSGITPC